jgi:hypothetical protein
VAADYPFILDGGLPPSNSFVVPDDKLVYISVTKAACSSLRWMVADLAGEDPQDFYSSTAPHPTRLMTIHSRRERWKKTPQLSTMSPEQLEQISVDNGWFIFAVVRDPWSRLWSAWQSKFLVRHTGFVRNFGEEPWFPRIPTEPEQVVEDFRRFVDARPWLENPQLTRDSHFWPQVRSVRPDGLAYSRVYDLSDMSALVGDIATHLKGLGKGTDLYLPRANETPLHLTRAVLADGVADEIAELYAADFEAWPDRWKIEDVKTAEGWTPDALRSVGVQASFYERLGDLSDEVGHLRAELRDARQEVKKLRRSAVQVKRAAAAPARPHEAAPTGLTAQAARVRRGLGRVRRALTD